MGFVSVTACLVGAYAISNPKKVRSYHKKRKKVKMTTELNGQIEGIK